MLLVHEVQAGDFAPAIKYRGDVREPRLLGHAASDRSVDIAHEGNESAAPGRFARMTGYRRAIGNDTPSDAGGVAPTEPIAVDRRVAPSIRGLIFCKVTRASFHAARLRQARCHAGAAAVVFVIEPLETGQVVVPCSWCEQHVRHVCRVIRAESDIEGRRVGCKRGEIGSEHRPRFERFNQAGSIPPTRVVASSRGGEKRRSPSANVTKADHEYPSLGDPIGAENVLVPHDEEEAYVKSPGVSD